MELKEKLETRTGLPVVLWDERLTSVAAEHAMIEGKIRREDRRLYVDKLAAVFILQGYLDSLRQPQIEKE
jgi:putative Holliday junction resolvase